MVSNTVTQIFSETMNSLVSQRKYRNMSLSDLIEATLSNERVALAVRITEDLNPTVRRTKRATKKAAGKKAAKKVKKGKPGRPKGSKNKAKDEVDTLYSSL